MEGAHGREAEADARAGHVALHHVLRPFAIVVGGEGAPDGGGAEAAERFNGGEVSGPRARRGVPLGFEVIQEVLDEAVRSGAGAGTFQTEAPMGAASGGWAVDPTSPVREVVRSNLRVAERVSTPSGEVATIGIS